MKGTNLNACHNTNLNACHKESDMSQISASDASNSTAENATIEQEPTLADEARLAELPLFHHASHASQEIAARPDRKWLPPQIDPTSACYGYYVFSSDKEGTNNLAEVIVTGAKPCFGMLPHREYWFIINRSTFNTNDLTELYISRKGMNEPPPPPPPGGPGNTHFILDQKATWSSMKSTVSRQLKGDYQRESGGSFGFAASFDEGKQITTITWYNSEDANVFSGEENNPPDRYKLTTGDIPDKWFQVVNTYP